MVKQSTRRAVRFLLAAAGASALCAPAPGQNALGDGRALDNNLQEGSGGRNTRIRNLGAELRLRESIVTGRAPGGLSFRGDVGYLPSDDFRGEIGEDDLFAFERDSLSSGLSTRGARGLEALQMQFTLTTGGRVGLAEDFLGEVRRPFGGSSPASLSREAEIARDLEGFDPLKYREGALRSTAEFLTQQTRDPILLRVIRDQEDEGRESYAIASPLRSVSLQDEPRVQSRLSELLEQTLRAPTGADALKTPEEDARVSNRLESGRTTYESILRQLAEGRPGEDGEDGEEEGDGPEAELEFDQEAWQDVIDGGDERTRPGEDGADEQTPRGDGGADGEDETQDGDGAQGGGGALPTFEEADTRMRGDLRRLREALMNPSEALPQLGGGEDEGEDGEAVDLERVRERLRADAERIFGGAIPEVEALTPAAPEGVDIFAKHMRRGQELLREQRWFDAEERFTSALGLKPGDPMAAVGRIHAQIGGGLFLSAGLNLQKLFRAHPELISTRYGRDLLPDPERLSAVKALLEEQLDGLDDFSRGAALTYAYLGWQFDDLEMIERGLDAVASIDEDLDKPSDTLTAVLRTAWLRD